MAVTIKDIAKHTGLSIKTVSNVLHHKPYYSKETEEKVLEAVEKYGYIANANAAALRSARDKNVAIIFDDMTNPFYFIMTDRIAGRLKNGGVDATIYSTYGRSGIVDRQLAEKILSGKTDAIVSMIAFGEDACRLVHRRGVPAVLLGRDGTQDGIESLFADDEQGGYMATKHLIERGHRRIIYLGAAKGLDVSERRAGGYRRALEEAGIEPDESLIVQYREFDRTLQKNMDLFMEYLYGSGATAVFAFNDNFAYRIMRRLDAIGKNVPQDFAVVGYDNLQDYLKLPLWLTTVGVDFLRMANAATDYVLAKIKGEDVHLAQFCSRQEPFLVRGRST